MPDRFDAVAHAEHARDQAARAQYGAEQQRAAAERQAKRELGVAEQAEKAAAELELKARRETGGQGYAKNLREQAGRQHALAEAARRRAHAADQEGDRLEMEALWYKRSVEALEAEWNAMTSRGIARFRA